jgi:hypothetical protein
MALGRAAASARGDLIRAENARAGDGTPPHNWYTGPGVAVSFDRPYGKYRQIFDAPLSTGSGEFLLWEFPLAYWMEKHGYDVSYVSNIDTHVDGEGLGRARAFLSVGHDEYWSLDMYQNVQRAIESGVHRGAGARTRLQPGAAPADRVHRRHFSGAKA